jgi:hypothetical protein
VAVEYDEIGIWSEVKLAKRRESIHSLRWLYIDAYAGPGLHLQGNQGNR